MSTVPASAPVVGGAIRAASPAKSPWIVSRTADLILFVATPALILPLALLALQALPPARLYALVVAFGAIGHHLPGMMRAYGDRALFARFRTRFLVAPVVLVATCTAFSYWNPDTLMFVLWLWGIWHGLMQTHGFLRIYDGRRGPSGRLTPMLDQAMCLAWFAAGIVLSPTRTRNALSTFYKGGGPEIPEALARGVVVAVVAITAVVTLAFLVNLVREHLAGRAASPIKLLLMVSSFGFWWLCNLAVPHLLVGILMFEIFHDVQYLAIVWLFNRKRADDDPTSGSFTRFLFRNRWWLVVLYVGLVFAYGSLSLAFDYTPVAGAHDVLGGLLAASALLHFYFDGFIWKMREPATRASLGIAAGVDALPRRAVTAGVHALKWGLFFVPLALLAAGHARSPMSTDDRLVALGRLVTGDAGAQHDMATVLYRRGDLDGALAASRRAWSLRHEDAAMRETIRHDLVAMLVESAQGAITGQVPQQAVSLLSEALVIEPQLPEALLQEALHDARTGAVQSAILRVRALLLMQPGRADARQLLQSLGGG